MADETKKAPEQFEDPEVLDIEDLQDVSGGAPSICDTGGGCNSNELE